MSDTDPIPPYAPARPRNEGLISRFFGGPPLWVAARLAFVSLIVGVIMSSLGLTPWDLFYRFEDFILRIWDLGFEAFARVGGYLLLGAAVVVPIWLVMRLSAMSKRG